MKRVLTSAVLLLVISTPTAPYRNHAETSAFDRVTIVRTATKAALQPRTAHAAKLDKSDAIEIDWDVLIPAGWRPDELMAEYNYGDLSDDDPRAEELLTKLRALWKEAPVVPEYDGKFVKLPGFVVPLEMDATAIHEFLLVPYYGACIHVPPPPANQTVHIVTARKHPYKGELFDAVWVTGKITVVNHSSELGDAGYRIDATNIEPYQTNIEPYQ